MQPGIWGHRPLKLGRAKNVQNSAWFRTTFDFDHEYLKNRSIYRKQETNIIASNPCCIEQKIGKLWSTNKKVIDADADPPKIECERHFEQLHSFVVNISETNQDINNWKQTWSTTITLTFEKKIGKFWFTSKKVLGADVDPP